jgi:hypothetical protein
MKKNNFSFLESGIFLFSILFIFLFREFLYTYKIQLLKSIPYYPYQNQIVYYITGDKSFDIQSPMNLRFLGLVIQFAIFKFLPCLEFSRSLNIYELPYPQYVCATYSNALMNYISLCGILTLSFLYAYKKLNLKLTESYLCVLFSYIFIKYIEFATLDRISVFYLLVVLYFLDIKIVSIVLIILASLVNEKIVYLLIIFFFIKFFFTKNLIYKHYFFFSIISGIIVVAIYFYFTKFLNFQPFFTYNVSTNIYDKNFFKPISLIFNMFFSMSGLTNGLFPLMICLLPYCLPKKRISNKILFTKFEMIVPLSLVFFATGGGTEQIGRYVMHSFPIWVPILSCYINSLLSDKK